MTHNRSTAKTDYPGRDLEAMSFAENYHQWIFEEFYPFIGKSVAEVGAGCGNFTRMLLKTPLEKLVAYEPSKQMFPLLATLVEGEKRAGAVNDFFGTDSAGNFDSIFYINVLEHIENDQAELGIIHSKLSPEGHLLIFVPALPTLFSEFDKSIGHYRRYRKSNLVDTLQRSGFSIVKIKYFDFAGIFPWYVSFVLLKKTLTGKNVALYDKTIVPVMRTIESLITPPIGKNILVVAKKA